MIRLEWDGADTVLESWREELRRIAARRRPERHRPAGLRHHLRRERQPFRPERRRR